MYRLSSSWLIVLLLIITLPVNIRAQFFYLDTIYHTSFEEGEYNTNCLELSEDRYVLSDYSADSGNYFVNYIGLNNTGGILWSKEYWTDTANGITLYKSCFDKYKNMVTSGQYYNPILQSEQGVMAKADSNGNLMWLKTYPAIPYIINQGFWVLGNLTTPSNQYLLIGQESLDSLYDAPFMILRTDSNGNELSHHYYGPPYLEAPDGGGINTNDNGYLFSGHTNYDDSSIYNNGTGYDRIFVVKADSAFNEVWETIVPTGRDANGIYDDGTARGEIEDSDGYLIFGNKPWKTNDSAYTYLNEGPRGWQKLWIGKLSKDSGKIMWEKMYGLDTLDYAGFYGITATPDGNYALCGVYGWDNFNSNAACVYKINHNGDSLWSVQFAYHDSFNIGVNPYTINTIGTAGYMITGYVMIDNNTKPYPWVYTIDSNGYSPYNVTDTITDVRVINEDSVILKIYPNPSSDYFIINYQFGSNNPSPFELAICNALGQTMPIGRQAVYSQQLPTPIAIGGGFQKIALSSFASGMYTVFIKRNGGVVASGKVVKE